MTDAPDPVPALKRQLARAILDRLGGSGQLNVARRLGVDQPRASNLQCGRLERFSLQQLVRLAARAGGEVTLSVVWTGRRIWNIPRQTPVRSSLPGPHLRPRPPEDKHAEVDEQGTAPGEDLEAEEPVPPSRSNFF